MAHEDRVDTWFDQLDMGDCEAIVEVLGALDASAIENKQPVYTDVQRKLITEAGELLEDADDEDGR